jgi:hypothetical protein
LTSSIPSLIDNIKKQEANAGGDYPEAVEIALKSAIMEQPWKSSAVARLLFLILDAPPHHSPATIAELNQLTYQAATKGIKIIPVAASGIDKDTEFLLRFLATTTNGTYTFLTNHSGIGNDHLTPTIGEYKVEYLNELIIRLINQYSKY